MIMSFIVKIENTGGKAESIINMLKNLASDYEFLEVLDENELPMISEDEFWKKYEYTIENIEKGKSWDEVRKELLEDN